MPQAHQIKIANKTLWEDRKTQLVRGFVSCGAYLYNQEDPFELRSGQSSPWYFDVRKASMDPICKNWISELLWLTIPDGVTKIGGVANGGYAIVAHAIRPMFRARWDGTKAFGFVVRREAKDHGTKRQIDGYPPNRGDKVLLVEDVLSTGGAIMQAIRICEAVKAEIVGIVPVVDRAEGATEEFKPYRELVFPILTKESFRVL